jgi:MFS transporter, OPA family, glycerol-3-phosphate transporter
MPTAAIAANEEPRPDSAQALRVGLFLIIGYMGIYLCRRNLSVAVPLLQESFGVNKATVGGIASAGTIAYMLGKFAGGPLVDRIGGRAGFLLSMLGVALFGAIGGLTPTLALLSLTYGASRFFGAGGWASMMKLTSTWIPPRRLGVAVGVLSLSFVLGGIVATHFAEAVVLVRRDWRWVMSAPSAALILLVALCALFVRPGPLREVPADEAVVQLGPERERSAWERLFRLLKRRQFVVVCILSFVLTLLRESLTTWSVDFLMTVQRGEKSLAAAALQSTSFDYAGMVSILAMGLTWDRLRPEWRRWLIAGILLALTLSLSLVTTVAQTSPGGAAWMLALVGLLIYGPYSILAGVASIESGGTDATGTATGFADGVGYLASILAGSTLGAILDAGGYPRAFAFMTGLAAAGTVAALGLQGQPLVVTTSGRRTTNDP